MCDAAVGKFLVELINPGEEQLFGFGSRFDTTVIVSRHTGSRPPSKTLTIAYRVARVSAVISGTCSIIRATFMKPKKLSKPHPPPVDALVYPCFSGIPTFMRLPT